MLSVRTHLFRFDSVLLFFINKTGTEPKVKELVVEVYRESLTGMTAMALALSKKRTRPVGIKAGPSELERGVKRVNEFSEKLIKEVEYLDRKSVV